MKKYVRLILFSFLLVFTVIIFNSCKKSSIVGYTCSDPTDACGTNYTTCCNTVDCYYKVGTKKYNCDGTDCLAAATKMVNDLCGTSVDLKSLMITNEKEEMLEVVQMLLEANEECKE
jgi:hypothetical protein